jgi:hypothetical protein
MLRFAVAFFAVPRLAALRLAADFFAVARELLAAEPRLAALRFAVAFFVAERLRALPAFFATLPPLDFRDDFDAAAMVRS